MANGYLDQVKIIDTSTSTEEIYDINRNIPADSTSDELSLVTASDKYMWNNKADISDISSTLLTSGIPYLTSAPSSSNTSGNLILVFLANEPATKYNGYLYFIMES